ncbi:hypothetical protein ACHAQH_009049, partial [Verticillium albo-atrum]
MTLPIDCDVLVIGSGNAGFSAAVSAAESGAAGVVLIDTCPEEWAGGNTYFTAGAYRTAHGGLEDVLPLVNNVSPEQAAKIELAPYLEKDFADDIERVCSGRSDPELARVLVQESNSTIKWLAGNGIRFQLSFNRQADPSTGHSVVMVKKDGKEEAIRAKAIIFAAGGFESNPRMRGEHLGPGWEKAMVRDTPFNTGSCLELCIRDLDAKAAGDWLGCHSVAWDAAANPDTGDREASNEYTKSGYPLGLMINVQGQRFVDEGVDFRNYTYARFGRAILAQPEHVAFQVIGLLAQECVTRGLHDPEAFVKTIRDYNEAVYAFQRKNPDALWDPAIKDGYSTQSSTRHLDLAKSNWALPLDQGPFLAVKVTCGVTFTFGGLQVDPESAQLISAKNGKPMRGLYCA